MNKDSVDKDKQTKKSKINIKEIRSWILITLLAFLVVFIFGSKVYAKVPIDQSSMEKTLFSKNQVIEDIISYNFNDPERGDIIIFYPNEEKGSILKDFNRLFDNVISAFDKNTARIEKHQRYVKRVIGIEGDIIDIRDGYVFLNDEKLEEPYVKGLTAPNGCNLPVTVGKDELFVMGDNRKVSIDSRELGVIHKKQVEGKVIFRVYPLNKMGKVK